MKLPSLFSYDTGTYFIYALSGWLTCAGNEEKLFCNSSFTAANISCDVIKLRHFLFKPVAVRFFCFSLTAASGVFASCRRRCNLCKYFFPLIPYSLVGSCKQWFFHLKGSTRRERSSLNPENIVCWCSCKCSSAWSAP